MVAGDAGGVDVTVTAAVVAPVVVAVTVVMNGEEDLTLRVASASFVHTANCIAFSCSSKLINSDASSSLVRMAMLLLYHELRSAVSFVRA